MDRGTFFLALVILLAAIGIGGGVWWYYTDIVPEQEAIREAIGILSWSKLMEGWTERKKRARDKREEEM